MSWLEEAQQKIKQKQTSDTESAFAPDDWEQREQLISRLKMLYDNATEREINKALDDALDRFAPPYEEKDFMNFLRTKLED